MGEDRDAIVELEDLLREARDKAHWLSVHRRMPLAAHIEDAAELTLRMTFSLRGQEQRGEASR